jgi:hypothetical protein
MKQAIRRPSSWASARACRMACAAIVTAATVGTAAAQQGNAVRDAIERLGESARISREITLQDLGFTQPAILSGTDARREIYLPIPTGIAISDAVLDIRGHYLRTDGGKATLLISLDGSPVWATAFTQDRGDINISLPIDGTPRRGGFVRLDAEWSSATANTLCGPEHVIGNVVAIDPSTRFSYRYDGRQVRDLATAWSALPNEPILLIASRSLARDSYDVAWRIGVALERAGKHPVTRAFPGVGDVVDTTRLTVPEPLKVIPAFAALARGEKHVIANNSEIGALMLLGAPEMRADVVVADARMTTVTTSSLEAIGAQIGAVAPNASAAFAEWRKKSAILGDGTIDNDTIRLVAAGGRPAIAIAPRAGAEAAALFTELWRRVALTKSLVVRGTEAAPSDNSTIPLSRLGGAVGTFDVLARGDWTTTFDLGNVARDGRIPVEVVVDVSAAPGAATSSPVASVMLNDVLLGAKRLNAEGAPERISARVPARILAPRNVLRVSFQRQPMSDHCRETPQAYPADVLPTSHLRLEKSTPTDDFSGMIARFATQGELIVPAAFISDAQNSLATVIRIAEAAGVSPEESQLTIVANRNPVMPKTSFLAFDVAIQGMDEKSIPESGRLALPGTGDRKIANITGFNFIGLAEVVRVGDIVGIAYRKVGENAPESVPPFRLGRGDVAVIGPQGPIAEIERNEPARGSAPNGLPYVGDWLRWLPQFDSGNSVIQRSLSWGVPLFIGAIVVIVVIILLAGVARRRSRADRS